MAEERHYKEQKVLSRFLELDCVEAFIKVEVVDGITGKVKRSVAQRSHSSVRSMYNAWFSHRTGAELKTAGYGVSAFSIRKFNDGAWGAANDSIRYCYVPTEKKTATGGVVVGSTDAAFSWSHYKLEARISNGTSTGKLYFLGHATTYSVTTVWTTAGRTWSWNFYRVLNNIGSQPVTFKEMGFQPVIYFGDQQNETLLFRDVLTTPVTVPTGDLVKVGYTIVSPAIPS